MGKTLGRPLGTSPGHCGFVSKMKVCISLKAHTHFSNWHTAHSNQPMIIVKGLDHGTLIKLVDKGHLQMILYLLGATISRH